MEILALAAVAMLLLQPFLADRLTNPALQAGATIFVSIVIQALPFLVLGVVLSAAIALDRSFVSREPAAMAPRPTPQSRRNQRRDTA